MESPNSSALSIDSNTQTSTRRWTDEEVKIVKDLLREHVEAENNDESPPMSMIEMWEKFSAQLTERGFHRSATAVQRRFRMQVSMRRESSRVKSESADVVKPDLQNASRSQNVVLGDLEPEANPTRATVNNDEKISKMEPNSAGPPNQYTSATAQAECQDGLGRKTTTHVQVDKEQGQKGPRSLRERKERPNYSVGLDAWQLSDDLSDCDTYQDRLLSEQVNSPDVKATKRSDSGNGVSQTGQSEGNHPTKGAGGYNGIPLQKRSEGHSTLSSLSNPESKPPRKKSRVESSSNGSFSTPQYMGSSCFPSMTGARAATVPNNASYELPQTINQLPRTVCPPMTIANTQIPQNNSNPSHPLGGGRSSMPSVNPQNTKGGTHIARMSDGTLCSNTNMNLPVSILKPSTGAREGLSVSVLQPGTSGKCGGLSKPKPLANTHARLPHPANPEPANNSNDKGAASTPGAGATAFGGGSSDIFRRVANEKLQALKGELGGLETEKVNDIKEMKENKVKIENWEKKIAATKKANAKKETNMKDREAKIFLAKLQIKHLEGDINARKARAAANPGGKDDCVIN